MFRRFSVNFALFSILFDAVIIGLSLIVATYIRPSLSVLPFAREITDPVSTPWIIYPVFIIEWIAINLLLSVYDNRKNFRLEDEIVSLTISTLLGSVALAGTLYLSFREISRLLFICFITLAYLFMIGWRIGFRFLRRQKPQSEGTILIVGAGSIGQQFYTEVQKNPQYGMQIAGFVDDFANPELKILGTIEDTSEIVNKLYIQDVIITLPQIEHDRITRIIEELVPLPVKVWIIPDYFQFALHQAQVEQFVGIPLMDLRAPAIDENQRLIKRAFDLIITILLLPIILPLMGIIAITICLESKGPILFRQQRIGENGVLFQVLKFRTMIPEAEQFQTMVEKFDDQGKLIHKSANDPRVTRVGKFLRRTSLDELPQFLNVLKGEMSLVGPRPELPFLVKNYEPWQRKRFAMPPGMTGWWQISGRSEKPMHLNTEDDLYYVQHYSLKLDIYILVKTIGSVLRGKGAF